jgi:hypothetical protein
MTDPSAIRNPGGAAEAGGHGDIDSALRRLMTALDALESAVDRRQEVNRDGDELAARIHALAVDRSRLAAELDTALVKSRKLERTNRETAARVDGAIDLLRAFLNEEAT